MKKEELFKRIGRNVRQGRLHAESKGIVHGLAGQPGVSELIEQALAHRIDPDEIAAKSLDEPLAGVLKKYRKNEFYFPHVVRSARCVGAARDILTRHGHDSGTDDKGTIVLAAVEGDVHEIGLQVVDIILKGAGYHTVNLGSNVPGKEIVAKVTEWDAPLVGLSAHTIDSRWALQEIIAELRGLPGGSERIVLVGGSPVLEESFRQMDADFYSRDVFEAVDYLAAMAAQPALKDAC